MVLSLASGVIKYCCKPNKLERFDEICKVASLLTSIFLLIVVLYLSKQNIFLKVRKYASLKSSNARMCKKF